MNKAKVAIVTLGHYIYFNQFDNLNAELMQKSDEFAQLIDKVICEVLDAGYIDCVEQAFDAVQKVKKADVDLLFVILYNCCHDTHLMVIT